MNEWGGGGVIPSPNMIRQKGGEEETGGGDKARKTNTPHQYPI